MKKQIFDLEVRMLEYSFQIIKIAEQLPTTKAGNHVAGKLLKAGSSAYPKYCETQIAELPVEPIHKRPGSLKDLRETKKWLKLIQRVPFSDQSEQLNVILQETEALIEILVKSVQKV